MPVYTIHRTRVTHAENATVQCQSYIKHCLERTIILWVFTILNQYYLMSVCFVVSKTEIWTVCLIINIMLLYLLSDNHMSMVEKERERKREIEGNTYTHFDKVHCICTDVWLWGWLNWIIYLLPRQQTCITQDLLNAWLQKPSVDPIFQSLIGIFW